MKLLWAVLCYLLLCNTITYAAFPVQHARPATCIDPAALYTKPTTVPDSVTITRHAGDAPQEISPGMFSVFLSVASMVGLLASSGTDKGLRIVAAVLAVTAVGIGIVGLFRKGDTRVSLLQV